MAGHVVLDGERCSWKAQDEIFAGAGLRIEHVAGKLCRSGVFDLDSEFDCPGDAEVVIVIGCLYETHGAGLVGDVVAPDKVENPAFVGEVVPRRVGCDHTHALGRGFAIPKPDVVPPYSRWGCFNVLDQACHAAVLQHTVGSDIPFLTSEDNRRTRTQRGRSHVEQVSPFLSGGCMDHTNEFRGVSQIAGISIQTDGITKEATLSAVFICNHCNTR